MSYNFEEINLKTVESDIDNDDEYTSLMQSSITGATKEIQFSQGNYAANMRVMYTDIK
jgi:hypothetical protein